MCLVCDWEHGVAFPNEMAEGCSFMLYDGMFTETEYPSRKGWGHSIWQEGVKLAQETGVPKLMIDRERLQLHHRPDHFGRG